MKKQQPYEYYEERRMYPRIVVNCPVIVRFKDKILTATVYDISPDGLQVRCTRKTLIEIHPSGRVIKADKAPKLSVAFSLVVGENKRQIVAAGEMYYFVLLPMVKKEDMDVAFGLRFKKLKKNSDKYIDELITESLAPIETKIRAFLDEPRTHSEIADHLELEPHNFSSLLIRLSEKGEIISIGSGKEKKHMHLASIIKTLLYDISELKDRVSSLEKSGKKR